MAYRVLLVPILGDHADRAALDLALSIGRPLNAHIVGVHVQQPLASLFVGNIYDPAPLPGSVIERMEEEHLRQRQAAAQLFRSWMADNAITDSSSALRSGPSAEWIETEAPVGTELAFLARTADLVVLPRTARVYSGVSDEALEGTLFHSGRPVLLLPGSIAPRPFNSVVIAWNDSREAAHAVSAAWSLIGRCKRITVFAGRADERLRRSAERFAGHIRRRGYAAPTIVYDESADTGWALLNIAGRESADLIVLGAYTHSRLRHLVLGGVTSHILSNATVPLLMAH